MKCCSEAERTNPSTRLCCILEQLVDISPLWPCWPSPGTMSTVLHQIGCGDGPGTPRDTYTRESLWPQSDAAMPSGSIIVSFEGWVFVDGWIVRDVSLAHQIRYSDTCCLFGYCAPFGG